MCICESLPLNYKNYTSYLVGTDQRYGEVEIKKCVHCNQHWLRYFVEYAHYTKSGRWYLGKIEESEIAEINEDNAIQKLENMSWYYFGGSFFDTTGKIGKGTVVTG